MTPDLSVDRKSDIPLGTQLAWKLRTAIATGLLRPGDRVPAVRELADVAGVNVNTVRSVYARLEEQGVRRTETHVWYGPAAAAIVDAARVHGADAIVMSTHGRSGLGRLVFGSVAEAVLRGTTLPILLIRPGGAPLDPPAGHGRAAPARSPEGATRREVMR